MVLEATKVNYNVSASNAGNTSNKRPSSSPEMQAFVYKINDSDHGLSIEHTEKNNGVTKPTSSNSVVDKYALQFAILFEIPVSTAKQLLSSEKFINFAKYAASKYSEYLRGMDKYQAAAFFKSLDSKEKAYLAFEAQQAGISAKNISKVFEIGDVGEYLEMYNKNGSKKQNNVAELNKRPQFKQFGLNIKNA